MIGLKQHFLNWNRRTDMPTSLHVRNRILITLNTFSWCFCYKIPHCLDYPFVSITFLLCWTEEVYFTFFLYTTITKELMYWFIIWLNELLQRHKSSHYQQTAFQKVLMLQPSITVNYIFEIFEFIFPRDERWKRFSWYTLSKV